jgi:hypothetical protein
VNFFVGFGLVDLQETCGPGGDDPARVAGVGLPGEQMIGVVETDEAFRVMLRAALILRVQVKQWAKRAVER